MKKPNSALELGDKSPLSVLSGNLLLSKTRPPFQRLAAGLASPVSGRPGRFRPDPQPENSGIALLPSVFAPLGAEGRRNHPHSTPWATCAQ